MDIGLFALLCLTAGAAFAQGFSGFGFGILLMSGLSLIGADLERASVFSTLSSLVLVVTLLVRARGRMRVDWKAAGGIVAGILVTIPVGYRFILRYGDLPVFRIVFGVFLILFATYQAARPHIRRFMPLFLAPVFGMISGWLSGAFASGGPPVVLYLYAREDDPRVAVGTMQAVFLGGNVYRLAVILTGERGLSLDLVGSAALLSPVVVAATLLGFHFARRVTVRPFLLAVYGLLILAGIVNVIKGIAG